MQIRSYFTAPLILLPLALGCSNPPPPPMPLPDAVVPLELDGTTIYVPKAWGIGFTDSPRPWRNGVHATTAGWGKFKPVVGPLGTAGQYEQPRDGIFRASSSNQAIDDRDPFFTLGITFEFPMPPVTRNWLGVQRRDAVYAYSPDLLELRYRAPREAPMPYLKLIEGLKPDEGKVLGQGWRFVTRKFNKRDLYIRFDALDWQLNGGQLPRRLAVSYSHGEGIWNHHIVLSPHGWSIDFDTSRLPLSRWRGKHTVAESFYNWLRKPPLKRNAAERFSWWEDTRDRPTH